MIIAYHLMNVVLRVINLMQKKKPISPQVIPELIPKTIPEFMPVHDPEEPRIPIEDPDFIPEEDPFETPPTEIPPPGEGP